MGLGLVLGAGGTAGEAFHRGVLRAMAGAGLDARSAAVVVGTSAGAVVGAAVRRHAPDAPGGRPTQPGGLRPAAGLEGSRADRTLVPGLLLTPRFHDEPMEARPPGAAAARPWPADPLWIVAVRRRDGARVVLGGPDAPVCGVDAATQASCALPGLFAPVEIGGEAYVDGGLHSTTNADVLAGSGCDLVVVSSPMSLDPRVQRPRPDLAQRLLAHRLLGEETWLLRRGGARVLAVEPDAPTWTAMGLNLMSAARVDEVEDRACALAARRLSTLPDPHPAA